MLKKLVENFEILDHIVPGSTGHALYSRNSSFLPDTTAINIQRLRAVEFYLYPTVGTVLIHSIKPELTE